MINHNEDNLEDALGARKGLKVKVKEAIFDYIKCNNGLKDKKSHLIEYVKDAVGINSENEMFLLGTYIKEFEMILDIKDTVSEMTESIVSKKRLVFNEKEFIEYINNDEHDF